MKKDRAILWNWNFWSVCLTNLCINCSLYMLLPAFPIWMINAYDASPLKAASILAVFGLSIFILGPFFNYIVDRFMRKRVCQVSLLIVCAASAGFYFVGGLETIFWLRILQGAMFGMAATTLGSTLAIDLSNSLRRTDANNAYYWFSRLSLAIGPLLGIFIYQIYGIQAVITTSIAFGIIAYVLITTVRIPFRAPLCPKICSLDRFLLVRAWVPFLNLLMIAFIYGLMLTCNMNYKFYGCMILGFLFSLFAIKFVFRIAEERSEITSGLIALSFAMLLIFSHPNNDTAFYLTAILLGLGIGMSTARFLLYFLTLAEHCERGTANTTYMLSWELGLALGYFTGYAMVNYSITLLPKISGIGVIVSLMALTLYLTVTHRYIVRNKKK